MFTNKLASKFIIAISSLIILTSFVLTLFFLKNEKNVSISEQENYTISLAQHLAQDVEYGVLTKNYLLIDNLVKQVMTGRDVIHIKIVDLQGKLLSSSGEKKEPFYESQCPIVIKKEIEKKVTSEEEMLFFEKKEITQEETIGTVYLTTSLTRMHARLNKIGNQAITITLIVIIIAILITYLIVGRITSPVKKLVLATKKISAGDLEYQVKVKTKDEIGQLANSFNKMTKELANTLVSKLDLEEALNVTRTLLEQIPVGLIIVGKDKKIVRVNPQATKMFGGESNEEMLGQICHQYICPAEVGKCPVIDLGNTVDHSERVLLTKDNKKIPILKTVRIINLEGEEVLLETFVDITERKKAEAALRESDERFKQVAENAGEWIWEVNAEGLYTYSNPIVEEILGYKPEEIVGKKYFYDFFTPEVKEELKKAAFEVFAKKETFKSFINPNVHKNGNTVILETNGTPVVDDKGNLRGYRGADRDITQRKQYEERLALINNCLLNFGADPLENIQSLTTICGEILGGVCSLYNRLEGEMLCSRGQWNVPPDYNPIDKPDGHICYDVIKQGSEQSFIVRNLPQTSYAQTDPNVTKYKLQTYIGQVVKYGGNYIGSICVVYQRDFIPSEDDKKFLSIIASAIGVEEGRKRAEDALKKAYEQLKTTQAQLLQSEKMAAIGQLAGGVAHEINNPMGVILGFAQSIVKRIKEDNFLYLPLKSIEREAIRCKKLVGDLLTFSRVGKTEKEIFDINEIIEQTLSLIESQTKIKDVKIIKNYDNNLPPVLINKNQIQQVIVNLCNNAIEAMPEGGTITITTTLTPAPPLACPASRSEAGEGEDNLSTVALAKAEGEGKFVEIRIQDTGKGMTEEAKKHLFEPFFTTKEVGMGTGLGLSLCYEIIQKHSGTIEVESEIDKGTKFTIKLPISK